MKRILGLLVLVIGTVAIFVYWGAGSATARAIKSQVELGPGHVFTLAEHTDFEWDRVFVFGPYTQRSEIEAALGFRWQGRFNSDIEDSDGGVLVVFEHAGHVVEHFHLSRASADLALCAGAGRTGLTRASARFVVGNNGAVSIESTAKDH